MEGTLLTDDSKMFYIIVIRKGSFSFRTFGVGYKWHQRTVPCNLYLWFPTNDRLIFDDYFCYFQDWISFGPNRNFGLSAQPWVHIHGNSVDLFHLFGISGHPAPTFYGTENWRGRIHYITLSIRIGLIPSTLYSQLDLQILFRG